MVSIWYRPLRARHRKRTAGVNDFNSDIADWENNPNVQRALELLNNVECAVTWLNSDETVLTELIMKPIFTINGTEVTTTENSDGWNMSFTDTTKSAFKLKSESSIRDIDMASEMMNFTKNSILQQAAQSMLAQANQQPQSILQMLG